MIISIVNHTVSIPDRDLQTVIRAVNRQIAEDFAPYWSFGATLRLEGKVGRAPDVNSLAELRGDAVIYVWDHVNMEKALGYHTCDGRGIPYGFVFTDLARQLGEPWSVTLSHEALELLGDAQGNLLVQGPHPEEPSQEVFHWFEMCDAVQSQCYEVDGVQVSNFLLPLYFTLEKEAGARTDFLGTQGRDGKALPSFGVAQGGYIGFYDPRQRAHCTYFAPADRKAQRRWEIKRSHRYGRGFLRSHAEATQEREHIHERLLAGAKRVRASAAAADDPIQHVVVLMMENRSFDQMLGGMRRFDPQVEGIDPAHPGMNTTDKGHTVRQAPTTQWRALRDRDPDHELAGTLAQLGSPRKPMSGFAQRYLDKYPDASQEELDEVMGYYDFADDPKDDALPVLHGLARHFAVCDHWFSSLPGPTWPNRFFVHSGTSLGHVLMPSRDEPQHMRVYYQDTIFDRLSDAGMPWKIYHDGIPQSIVMTQLLKRYLTLRGYGDMADFLKAADGPADDFPAYCFIEPRYFGAEENDQHPPADVRRGEQLIADVYNALRKNAALWNSTLLVVLYDEPGGFYDHVSPPATVPPDEHTAEYGFDRLGVRVPALLVSPWIDRKVISTVFDHTSLLRYLCEKWHLPPLGQRMQAQAGALRSNSFGGELLLRQSPRVDTPERLEARPLDKTVIKAAAVSSSRAAEPPIEGSREALLLFVSQLPDVPVSVPEQAATQTPGVRARRTQATARKVRAVPPAGAPLSVEEAQAKLDRLRKGGG